MGDSDDPFEALKALPEAPPHLQPEQVWPDKRALVVRLVGFQTFGGWGEPFTAFGGAYVYCGDQSYGKFGEASWDDNGKRVSGSYYEFRHSEQVHQVRIPNGTRDEACQGLLAAIGAVLG